MSSELEKKVQILKENVEEFPDFPKPGVLFRDMFSLFRDPKLMELLREVLTEYSQRLSPPIDCVVALDARGFLLGPFIALDLKLPFVPVRKKGKLPGETVKQGYSKEYGEDILEMQTGSIKPGQQVLIVDDLLATGGSLGAACKLVEKVGAKVSSCLVLMELDALEGRKKIPADVISIFRY